MISTDTLYRLLAQASVHETIKVPGVKFAEILKELIDYRKKHESASKRLSDLFGSWRGY